MNKSTTFFKISGENSGHVFRHSKRLMRLGTALLVLTTSLFGNFSNAQQVFVSPSGSDSNSGTDAGSPVKSFQKAADVAASLSSSSVTVEFASGEYLFNNTVVLNNSHANTSFVAATGATPEFTSLKQVTGWTVHAGNVMVADLPTGVTGQVRFLQDKSEDWMSRSATAMFRPAELAFDGSPEAEHFELPYQINKTRCKFPSAFSAPDWTKASQYDLRARAMPWNCQILKIDNVNSSTRYINMEVYGHYSLNDGGAPGNTETGPYIFPGTSDTSDLSTEAWVMNSIAGIDSPGEWACIDGKIYLYPLSGTSDIYVPALSELIRIDDNEVLGAKGATGTVSPVANISFNGIAFTGGDYRPLLQTDFTTQHDWDIVDKPTALIRLRNTTGCSFTNCTFRKSGGTGIRMDRYAQNNKVDNCTFEHLGRTGVTISGRAVGWGDVNHNNAITNSYFNKVGQIKWDAPGVLLDQSSNNLIDYNRFENIYMSAIIMSGARTAVMGELELWREGAAIHNKTMHWDEMNPDIVLLFEEDTITRHCYFADNVIEYNTFRNIHVCPHFEYGGFSNGLIYLTGSQYKKTNHIRKNYFYDCQVNGTAVGFDTWLLLGDGFMDSTRAEQNMVHNWQGGDAVIEPAEVWNLNCNEPDGGCMHRANVVQNSSFGLMENTVARASFWAGNIDLSGTNPVGDAALLEKYKEMWCILSSDILPGTHPLPGEDEMQTSLESVISSLGGSLPTACTYSIPESLNVDKVQIYPNPNNGHFAIELESGTIIQEVSIFNATGQLLQTIKGSSNKTLINMPELSSGIYLVKVTDQNNLNYTSFLRKD